MYRTLADIALPVALALIFVGVGIGVSLSNVQDLRPGVAAPTGSVQTP